MCNHAFDKKVDLSNQLDGFYGQHRSGWPYVLQLLAQLHNPAGTLLDTFIERTFCWHPDGIKANLRPWIGFIHVPPQIPKWFHYEQSNAYIFKTRAWKKSLPFCQGLFTLSHYHKSHLESVLPIPIHNLLFPTETPELKWSAAAFTRNRDKKVIQIGWWLRKLHSIYRLPTRSYQKVMLKIAYADIDQLMEKERKILKKQGLFDDALYNSVATIPFVSNQEFDKLLAENIVFIELYDSSANNTVIECMVRNTPILVNPLPAIVEYLGADYPFYFQSMEEAAAKAENLELIYKTHAYLQQLPGKEKLSGEFFLQSLAQSAIYQNL